ncbi:MAG: MFS transporter [Gammaproteobacteria bacterium]
MTMENAKSGRQNNKTAVASPWSPLQIPLFRSLWCVTIISNVGTWMHDVGAGWLMTSLAPSPVMVALIQTATTLPIFLLAMPAGALADIFDRRRYLITALMWMMMVAGVLGILTLNGVTNAWILVALTFAMGIGTAMMLPAWAAVTPEIVPRSELQRAISLNSMGMNVARAIGPALAGIIISMAGSGAVFIINSISFLFVVAVLWRWRRVPTSSSLPAERFLSALKSGVRFARHSTTLHATLVRNVGFFLFTSALWALLPLVARQLLGGGPQTFGALVASIGTGAVLGALLLPRLRSRFSSNQLVTGATVLFSCAMIAIAYLHQLALSMAAMALCGVAWISVISSLQVAAQMALPDWVRSRGLAVFMTILMGSMAAGSLLWGKVAAQTSIPFALVTAAAGAIIAALLTWRWSISNIENIDLTPSMHWTTPLTHDRVTHDRAPVMVLVHYHVKADKQAEFMTTIHELGQIRRRDGAYAWDVLEDAEKPGYYLEYYMVESWLEHLRQHERVTNADQLLQERLRRLLVDNQSPPVTHFVGPNTL